MKKLLIILMLTIALSSCFKDDKQTDIKTTITEKTTENIIGTNKSVIIEELEGQPNY